MNRSRVSSRSSRATVVVLAAMLVAPVRAATFAGVDVPAPLPATQASDTYFGTAIADPYRPLESVSDPTVQKWMKAQSEATAAILAKLPGRDALLAQIKDIESNASGMTDQAVRAASGRFFYLRRGPKDNQFSLVYRDSPAGAERLIVDPEALARQSGTPHAIMDFTPSRDGKRIAYALQAGGGEIGTLHVIDVATGKPVVAPIDRIRYANVSWLDDGSGFFYSRLREGYETMPPGEKFADRALHFHALDGAGTDRRVFSPGFNADLGLPTYASGYIGPIAGTKRVANVVSLGVERHRLLYLADLDAAKRGTAKWQRVLGIDDKVRSVALTPEWIYVLSSKRSPRFEVLRMPLASPDLAKAEVVVPAGESVITGIRAARDAVYVVSREGVPQSLWRVAHAKGSRPERIALPFEGSVDITGATLHRDGVVLELSGWTRSIRPYVYEPAARKLAMLPFVAPGAYDAPDDLVAREVRVKSHDGVEVPVSIVARKDLKLDGSHPTIVYGYGAYASTDDPFFNPRVYAWLKRGGVYAYAHVRGGGAFGEEWHLAGRKATKPNTWKDAIAAAEWLIANGYSSKSRLALYGGSAGGILVGRAITERPDLFAVAVPAVGVFDTTRAELSANGAANIPEFGSMKNEAEARALLAMSTYHAIRDGAPYPAVMFDHGVNDIRVDVWQSLKGAARLASATGSGKPVLLRLDYDSGHGQGSTRAQSQARMADTWAFMLWQMGVPEFQPAAATASN
jgi:prolyl oligopeptidase